MRQIGAKLKAHRHILIVVTLLTLAMTFPTIAYVFRADMIWHPAGSSQDVYIHIWDVWYAKLFLTGGADRLHTSRIFYPHGVSLAYHPFFIPHVIVVNALSLLLPLTNAFSLAYLLVIFFSALSAYIYLFWLFNDRWLAIFGAVVFGFSPHVVNQPNYPQLAFVATLPLALYGLHRGIVEGSVGRVALAGFWAGLTAATSLYVYVCVLISMELMALAFLPSRWRDGRFWRLLAVLAAAIAATSAPWLYPMMTDSRPALEVATAHGAGGSSADLISMFINHDNPVLGPLAESFFGTPDGARISRSSFLGYLPLLLIGLGLLDRTSRRKMLPWLALCAVFLLLRLGARLSVNGVLYPEFLLPKHYLDQILPVVFAAFYGPHAFMIGVILPMAALAGYGLAALRRRFSFAAGSRFALVLISIVALEYWTPIETTNVFPVGDGTLPRERFAFIDWLAKEEGEAIALINLPMGRVNAKVYNLYQALGGFPRAEGAISRTPDSAYDYLRANPVTSIWLEQRPTNCVLQGRAGYLAGIAQLLDDGFTHVVHHHGFYFWQRQIESFRYVDSAYQDDYTSIYTLGDLLNSCPD